MVRRYAIHFAVLALMCGAGASASRADFTVCNYSNERAEVSIGYNHTDFGWTSEGWWKVPIDECKVVQTGPLRSRYYYIYATGHRGGVWRGSKDQDGGFFCTSQAKYTYLNREYQSGNVINCEKRGLKTIKFHAVDTENSDNFTFNLRN